MHRDPEPVAPDILTDLSEVTGKVLLPGKCADRVRRKWYQIGCDPKKEQVVHGIVCKDFFKAGKVFPYRIPQPIL